MIKPYEQISSDAGRKRVHSHSANQKEVWGSAAGQANLSREDASCLGEDDAPLERAVAADPRSQRHAMHGHAMTPRNGPHSERHGR